jgi:hypothetical protein
MNVVDGLTSARAVILENFNEPIEYGGASTGASVGQPPPNVFSIGRMAPFQAYFQLPYRLVVPQCSL